MENIIGNINTVDRDGQILIKSENSIFYDSFYFQGYYDDKLITKFLKSTEAIIRQSKEYNDYLSLVKTNYNILTYDNVQSNIGSTDTDIEFHHYPFTLYEIAETLMADHIANEINFTSFSLAKEIMELHFEHMIGFVPLSKTNHELAQDDALFISSKQVFGKWDLFLKKYEKSISPEKKDFIKNMISLSDANIKSDYKGIY